MQAIQVTKFKCPICPYESCHKSSLRTHMKTHSAERPWKCDICQKTFKLKHHLKHHLVTHKFGNGISSFKCQSCSYRGTSSISLLLHRQIKHGEPIPQLNMQRTLNNTNKYTQSQGDQSQTPTWTSATSLGEHFPMPPVPISTVTSNVNFSCPPVSAEIPRIRSLSDSEGLPTITKISSSSDLDIPQNFSLTSRYSMQVGNDGSVQSCSSGESPFVKDESQQQKSQRFSSSSLPFLDDQPDVYVVSGPESGDKTPIHSTNSLLKSPITLSFPSTESEPSTSNEHMAVDVPKPDILVNHGDNESTLPASTWKCDPCGIIFNDNIMYGLHTACHSVHQPYKCNICGKVCRDKYDFTFHITMGKH